MTYVPSSTLMSRLYPDCIQEVDVNTTATPPDDIENNDDGAVLYIVAVLLFYSFGIVVMIVTYLKTEKKEMEDEAALDNFLKRMPDVRRSREMHVNKVAIQAFHALTSVYNGANKADKGKSDKADKGKADKADETVETSKRLLITDV